MKSIKWLDKNFELMILAIFLVIMSLLSFSNVIMRYCFHHALSWSDEVLLLQSGAVGVFLSPMCCAYGDKY